MSYPELERRRRLLYLIHLRIRESLRAGEGYPLKLGRSQIEALAEEMDLAVGELQYLLATLFDRDLLRARAVAQHPGELRSATVTGLSDAGLRLIGELPPLEDLEGLSGERRDRLAEARNGTFDGHGA